MFLYSGSQHYKEKYKEQRSAGFFDTKLRVHATTEYFNQMIREANENNKSKKKWIKEFTLIVEYIF